MNIKRIINAALCTAIASGGVLSNVATPVMASNADDSTLLTYEVTEKYTWTAPASFEVTESSNGSEVITGTVNVLENVIADGMSLKISIKPDQAFELTDVENPDNKRAYTVKKGDTVINAGDTVLKVAAGVNTGSVDLDFQLDEVETEKAGDYSGTTGFVASVTGFDGDGVNVMLTDDHDNNGYVSKGDTLTFAASYLYADPNSASPTKFTVLKANKNGTVAELFAKDDYQTGVKFYDGEPVTTVDSIGGTVVKYEGSNLDTLLNETYYNSLKDEIKAKIISQNLPLNSYHDGNDWTGIQGTIGEIERNVYALSCNDIREFGFGNRNMLSSSSDYNVLLRSVYSDIPRQAIYHLFGPSPSYNLKALWPYGYADEGVARPAFTIRLD